MIVDWEAVEQLELWPVSAVLQLASSTYVGKCMADPNPLVQQYGFGPDGVTCKACKSLYYHQRANRYYKCKYRPFTFGPGSDHRVGWNACALFSRQMETFAPSVLN